MGVSREWVHSHISASLWAVALCIVSRKYLHVLVILCISVLRDLLAANLHLRLCCPSYACAGARPSLDGLSPSAEKGPRGQRPSGQACQLELKLQ